MQKYNPDGAFLHSDMSEPYPTDTLHKTIKLNVEDTLGNDLSDGGVLHGNQRWSP